MQSDPRDRTPRSTHVAATSAVVVAWALACAPLWVHGFPHGQDASFELFRIAGYRNALEDGQWPPYWGGDFFVGYGSPIYLYYAPAFMALASAASWLTGSLLSAAVVAATLLLALAAWAMYCATGSALVAVSSPVRHQLACLAAVVYVLHPYLLATLYLRNALAEFAALCLFPLSLWSLLLVLRGVDLAARARAILGIAGAFAVNILAHNLSALVATAFMLCAATAILARHEAHRITRITTLTTGIALGLSLAAYFWVPALGYNALTRTGIELREGKLDFHNNFVPFLSNFGWTAFYSAGPLLPLALLLGCAQGLRGRRATHPGSAFIPGLGGALLAFGAVLLLLQFRFTTPVWEHLPFLALVQFPFRFLGQLGFVGALCVAALALPWLLRLEPSRWPVLPLGALALFGAQAWLPLGRAQPLPVEVQSAFDAAATPDAIRNNPGAMATFRWEYIPRAADRDLWKGDPSYRGAIHHALASHGKPTWRVQRDDPREVRLEVSVPEAGPSEGAAPPQAGAVFVFRRWMVPGWRATLDGQDVGVSADPKGLVAVGVAPGTHRLVLSLSPPPLRAWSLGWSGLSLLGAVGLWLRSRRL